MDLRTELSGLFERDRTARETLWRAVRAEGPNSEAYASAQAQAARVFDANARALVRILEEHGWPGEDEVGPELARAAFLMLQHADLATQERHLPVVRAATDAGRLDRSLLPLLEDRVRLGRGEEQVYGTQLHHDAEGRPRLWPIEDVKHVDARRAEAGLEPLAAYLRRAGLAHLAPGGAAGDT